MVCDHLCSHVLPIVLYIHTVKEQPTPARLRLRIRTFSPGTTCLRRPDIQWLLLLTANEGMMVLESATRSQYSKRMIWGQYALYFFGTATVTQPPEANLNHISSASTPYFLASHVLLSHTFYLYPSNHRRKCRPMGQ